MYNRNRLITATVIFLFVAEIATMCAILAVTIPKFEFNPQCIVTAAPLLFSSYWYAGSILCYRWVLHT